MTRTLVDTSVWFAAANVGDAGHERAKHLLRDERGDLLISDHILVETWRLLHHRIGYAIAEHFLTAVRSGGADLAITTSEDVERALQIGHDFPDQSYPLVDRTSFSVMLRLGVQRVLTFDDHFVVFRHGPRRERAFEVVR